ncbi:MAG: hypothetical protein ACREIT_03070 [Tepidisphaeraceae bacterium]
MKQRWWPILAIVFVALVVTSAAVACPMCKDSIPNGEGASAPPSVGAGPGMSAGAPWGFNFSIYYMLAGMLLVLGLVVRTSVKGIRSADAARSRGVGVSGLRSVGVHTD